jgi:hypothetical protein
VGATIGAVVDVITDVAIIAGGAYLVMSAVDAYDSARDYATDKAVRSRPKCSRCHVSRPWGPLGIARTRAQVQPRIGESRRRTGICMLSCRTPITAYAFGIRYQTTAADLEGARRPRLRSRCLAHPAEEVLPLEAIHVQDG